MADYASTELLRDQEQLWECAMQLFFTRKGGATIEADAEWHSMDEGTRAEYARDAIAIQRDHAKTLSHLPYPNFENATENGTLLSG